MPQSFMDDALGQARDAQAASEVPVGAVVVRDGAIIALAGNRTLRDRDPTAHAEILAIRMATRTLRSERLTDCDLYVTLEPCAMCTAAISFARIRRLYYGAVDPKGGAVENGVRFFASPTCHHAPDVYSGVGESEAARLLREFFRAFAFNAELTLHVNMHYGENLHHIAEATFKAVGRALAEATRLNPRIAGVLSTKGTL